MIYGVKIIKTYSVGEYDKRFYEELILKVTAESFDDAYKKAEDYMKDAIFEYKNLDNELVKTLSVEAVDCFLSYEPEGDVQEIYSSFTTNKTHLSDEEYSSIISSTCTKDDLKLLRNGELN